MARHTICMVYQQYSFSQCEIIHVWGCILEELLVIRVGIQIIEGLLYLSVFLVGVVAVRMVVAGLWWWLWYVVGGGSGIVVVA